MLPSKYRRLAQGLRIGGRNEQVGRAPNAKGSVAGQGRSQVDRLRTQCLLQVGGQAVDAMPMLPRCQALTPGACWQRPLTSLFAHDPPNALIFARDCLQQSSYSTMPVASLERLLRDLAAHAVSIGAAFDVRQNPLTDQVAIPGS